MTIFVYHRYSQAYAHFNISAVDVYCYARYKLLHKVLHVWCYSHAAGFLQSQSVDELKDTSSTSPRSRPVWCARVRMVQTYARDAAISVDLGTIPSKNREGLIAAVLGAELQRLRYNRPNMCSTKLKGTP